VPVDEDTARQLRELKQIKRDYARLQEEHELLKKAIRFSSEQKAKSLSSSKPRGKGIGSK
jgi:transposase